MPRRSVGGYLKRHWLAFALGAFVVFSEILILTQSPIDRANVGEASQDAGHGQEASRQVPPFAFAWIPIRARLLRFVQINLFFIERYHDTLNAVSTLAVAIFTATLWNTTRGLYISGEKQIALANRNAAAAERAADVAAAALQGSNRAWLKVSADISGPLQIINSGIVANVLINCENVGTSPAIKLGHHVWIERYRPRSESLTEMEKKCEASRTEVPFHEFVIFANESFPEMTESGTWKFVARCPIETIWNENEIKGGELNLIIFGCVNYTFASDPNRMHQTRFLYELWRKKATERFSKEDMPISRDSFTMRRSLFAAGYYAD